MTSQASKDINVPTPEWFIPFLDHKMYKGIAGGRGSGKSHSVAERLIENVIHDKADLVCIREKQKSLQFSAKKLIETKIKNMGLQDLFIIQDKVIKTIFGNIIIFEGMANHTADSIKSLEGFQYAWFEEAQNCSQRSLDLLLPTIRADKSEVWFTWNPYLESDPIDRLFVKGFDDKIMTYEHVNYDGNPWFPDTLRVQMEYMRDRDPEKYAHIWLGRYETHSEALIFKNWRVEEFEAPKEAVFRMGADWGFSIDPTVALRCHLVENTLYIDYEAYRIGCQIVDLPELLMQIPDAEKWNMTADSARPETISHLRRHGFPKIRSALKGAGSIADGVSWLQSYDIVVHPRCRHTIDELASYRYKTDQKTLEIIPVFEDKNNHLIDALRYATEGLRRANNQNKKPALNILQTSNKW